MRVFWSLLAILLYSSTLVAPYIFIDSAEDCKKCIYKVTDYDKFVAVCRYPYSAGQSYCCEEEDMTTKR